MTNVTQSIVCDGLEKAAQFEITELVDVAWSLRGTLDEILDFYNDKENGDNFDLTIAATRSGDQNTRCVAVTSFPPVLTSMMMVGSNNTALMPGKNSSEILEASNSTTGSP